MTQDPGSLVLAVLREQGPKMSTPAIAQATGLDEASVDSALLVLQIRREVVFHDDLAVWPPRLVWSAVDDSDGVWRSSESSFSPVPEGREGRRAQWRSRKIVGDVTVVSKPAGDVPSEVREAWVGLTVPVSIDESTPRWMPPTCCVLQRPARECCYAIDWDKCISPLRQHAPEAAVGWARSHQRLVRGSWCAFPVENCEFNPHPFGDRPTSQCS